jgi:hypothetical protein
MAQERGYSSLAMKVGIAGAVSLGAIATGFFLSRRGRHVVREAWEGRRRTRLEDRVLDRFWGDPLLGRRRLDVEELDRRTIAVSGRLFSPAEHRRCLSTARATPGVEEVVDRLTVEPRPRRHGFSSLTGPFGRAVRPLRPGDRLESPEPPESPESPESPQHPER